MTAQAMLLICINIASFSAFAAGAIIGRYSR